MIATIPGSSHRRICRVLNISRAPAKPTKVEPTSRRERPVNALLAERIRDLIQPFPTFGYRRLWACLRFREGLGINKKTVYRILQIKGWFVHQRKKTPRPRVRGWKSQATASNQRWAMDVTHIPCGTDGWAHLAAVIDCHDREIVGYELALRSRVKEAERALEEACLRRFGTLRPRGDSPVIRSDNGLIFQSRRFRAACRDYQLTREFITPLYPGAERHDRALLPKPQRRVRLAPKLPQLQGRTPGHIPMDPLVQPRTPTPGPELPIPRPGPGATITPGGLKSGEHYTGTIQTG